MGAEFCNRAIVTVKWKPFFFIRLQLVRRDSDSHKIPPIAFGPWRIRRATVSEAFRLRITVTLPVAFPQNWTMGWQCQGFQICERLTPAGTIKAGRAIRGRFLQAHKLVIQFFEVIIKVFGSVRRLVWSKGIKGKMAPQPMLSSCCCGWPRWALLPFKWWTRVRIFQCPPGHSNFWCWRWERSWDWRRSLKLSVHI